MLKKYILILLLTILSLPAQSLFDDALQEDQSSSAILNYELNGFVRAGIYAGRVPEKSGYQTKDQYGEAALKLRLRKSQSGDAYSELRFRNRFNSESPASSFVIREAYVNAYLGVFDLRIGQQVVQWGKADGYNPTNVITPLDLLVFSPDENDRRSSNFLFRSYYNWSAIRFEAIWIPVYKTSILPFNMVELPDGMLYSETDFPSNDIKYSSFAFRLHYEGAGFDGSLSYFKGFMPMPGLSARSENSILEIYPAAYAMQMIGADVSTAVGAYGIRAEFAYKKADETDNAWKSIPKMQFEYIVGLDREFRDFGLIIQYIGKRVSDFENIEKVGSASPDFVKYKIALWNRMLTGQLEEWTHAISFRPALKLYHEILSLELLGQINFSTEEIFIKPVISYSIADDLTLLAGAQIFKGPQETLYGMLDENRSAAFIEFKASF